MTKQNQAVVIETLPPMQLNITKAALTKLKKACKAITAVPTNGEQYKALTVQIGAVRTLRSKVEHRRKELKAPVLDWGRKLDTMAHGILDQLQEMETPLKALKLEADAEKARRKAEKEAAERERVARLQALLNDLRNSAMLLVTMTVADARQFVAELEARDIGEEYAELQSEAEMVRQTILIQARQAVAAKEAEAEDKAARQFELDTLRQQREEEDQARQAQAEADRKAAEIEEAKAAKRAAAQEAKKAKAYQKKLAADASTFLGWDYFSDEKPKFKTTEGQLLYKAASEAHAGILEFITEYAGE